MESKKWGGYREGAGRTPLNQTERKKVVKIYISDDVKLDILKYGKGNSFSGKTVELVLSEISNRKNNDDFIKSIK